MKLLKSHRMMLELLTAQLQLVLRALTKLCFRRRRLCSGNRGHRSSGPRHHRRASSRHQEVRQVCTLCRHV